MDSKKGVFEASDHLNSVLSHHTELSVFPDNCGEQISYRFNALKLEKREHYFLPCDHNFGIIKRALKIQDRI